MAVKYVRKSGSDSNGGTSPSDAWLTIGKALGASGIASGDTVYVGAGTYAEAVSVAMTSPTAETFVIGDVDGSHTGDAGYPIITNYTSGFSSAPAASNVIALSGRDHLTFQNFLIVAGGAAAAVNGTTSHSTDIKFQDCGLIGGRGQNGISYTGLADTAGNWTIDRCRFLWLGGGRPVDIILPTTATAADYDANVVIQNSGFYNFGASACINVSSSGANSNKGGGVDILGCDLAGGGACVNVATGVSATAGKEVAVYGCKLLTGNSTGALVAATSGQIVEDKNYFFTGATARTNVTAGANSNSDYSKAPLLEFGFEVVAGGVLRPFLMPMAGSPLLGFGDGTGVPATDMLGRIRPAGGASATKAAGALERHDTAIAPGTTVGADSGSGYTEIVGPGDHEFPVPVDATAQTFTIKTKTSGYSGTNYPRMQIVNGGECGVADASVDATSASSSAYESISLGPFTPTAKGIVTVRLLNRTGNGSGIVAFDTFTVT